MGTKFPISAILTAISIYNLIVCAQCQPIAAPLQTAGLLATFSLSFKDGPGFCCGFMATYYPSTDFSLGASSTSALVPFIDFSLNAADVLPSSLFGLRYSGYITPTYPMIYTFQIGLANTFTNERYRLYIGTSFILNFWSSAPAQTQSATMRFTIMDLPYTILLEYKHTLVAGNAGLTLMWKSHPKTLLSVLGLPGSTDIFQPYTQGLEVGFPRNGRILCEYSMADGKNKHRLKVVAKGRKDVRSDMDSGFYHPFFVYSRVSVAGTYFLSTSILHKNGLLVAIQGDDPVRPNLPPFILVQPSETVWPQAITEMYTHNIDMLDLLDKVAVRMLGYLAAPMTSVYTFYFGLGTSLTSGTQRMAFWLGDRWLLNNSVVPMQATSVSCTIELSSDQIYDIEIQYFSLGAVTYMTIDWIYGSRARTRLPSEFLYASKIPQPQLNITVVSNSSACATRSYAFGSGLSVMTSGRISTFSISLKDYVGNKISVSSTQPIPVSVRWMLSDNGCSSPNQCRFSKGTVTNAGISEYQVQLRAPQTSSTVFYDRYRVIPSMYSIDLLHCCGFSATYYPSAATTAPSIATGVKMIQYSQAGEFWAANPLLNSFRSRYIGMLFATVSEVFTFFVSVTENTDKYQLIVDNLVVIDAMATPIGTPSKSATISLSSNDFYEVKLNYWHTSTSSPKLLKLEAQSLSTGAKHTLGALASEVYKPYPIGLAVGFSDGVAATYYSDTAASTPVISTTQSSIDWSNPSDLSKQPFLDNEKDGVFAARFSGIFKPTLHGIYTFSLAMGTTQESARFSINEWTGSFSSSSLVLTATYYASAVQHPMTFIIDYKTKSSYLAGAKFVLSFAVDNSWMRTLQYDGILNLKTGIGKVDQTNTRAPISYTPFRTAVPDPNFDWTKLQCPSQIADANPILLDRAAQCQQQYLSGLDDDVRRQTIFESTVASMSTSNGNGLTVCTVAVACSFTITVQDRYQNIRTTGDDVLELKVLKGSTTLSSFAVFPIKSFPRQTAADYNSKFSIVYVPDQKFDRTANIYMILGVVNKVSTYNSPLISLANPSFNGSAGLIFVQIAAMTIPVMPNNLQFLSNFSYFSYPTIFTAGISTSISLVAFDAFNNPVTSVPSNPSIFVSQPHFVMILGKPFCTDLLCSQALSNAFGADILAWDQTRSFSSSAIPLQSGSPFNTGSNTYSFPIAQSTKSGTYRVLCGIAMNSGQGSAAGPVGIGLSATYYNDEQGVYANTSYASNMPIQNSDFVWSFKRHQGPDPTNALAKDGSFSIRYAGYLRLGFPATGYTFTATVGHINQSVRVLLDGVPILDRFTETWADNAGLSKTTGLIGAAGSVLYPFDLLATYYHAVDIFWSSRGSTDDETIFKLQLQINNANILKTNLFPRVDLVCPDITVVAASFCASTSTRYLKSSTTTVTAGSPIQIAVNAKDSYYNSMPLTKRKLAPGLIACFTHAFLRPDDARTAGTYGYTSPVVGVSTTGTGSGAEFLVVIDASPKYVRVNITAMGKGYAIGDTVTIPKSQIGASGADIVWKVACVQFNGGLCGRIDSNSTQTTMPSTSTGTYTSAKGSIVSIFPYLPRTDPYWVAGTYSGLSTTCIDYRYLNSNIVVSCLGSGAQVTVVVESSVKDTCNTPTAAGAVACSGKISWVSSVTISAVGSGYSVNDVIVVGASSLGVNLASFPSSRNFNITVQTVVRGNGAQFTIAVDGSLNMFVSLLNAGSNYSKYENILFIGANGVFGSLNVTVLEVVGDVSQAISPIYASAASLGCSVTTPITGIAKFAFGENNQQRNTNFIAGTPLVAAAQTSTSGKGSGATFTLTVTTFYLTVAITALGTNYAIGDTVTINTAGTTVGNGNAPAIVLTVQEIGGAFLSAIRMTEPVSWTTGTTTAVTGTTSGWGTGAQFTIVYQTTSPILPILRIIATAVGSGYKTGDTITITLSPATVANPLVLLVDATSSIPSCPPVLKTIALDSGSCANCPNVAASFASFSPLDTILVNLNPTISGAYQIEVAVGVGQGLMATYYATATPDISSYSSAASDSVVIVPGIDFSVSSGDPFPNSCKSARFRGFIFPSQAATYTFYLNHKATNDRAKLWVDGNLLIDTWNVAPSPLELSATFTFHKANIPFDIHVIYKALTTGVTTGLALKWEHMVFFSALHEHYILRFLRYQLLQVPMS